VCPEGVDLVLKFSDIVPHDGEVVLAQVSQVLTDPALAYGARQR
jgi:hypothetical protein